jgi:hypothetical protein
MRQCYKVLSFEEIDGLETLWEIAVTSENEKVKEESSNLLSILYLKLDDHRYENDK